MRSRPGRLGLACLCFVLAGCGGTEADDNSNETPEPTDVASETVSPPSTARPSTSTTSVGNLDYEGLLRATFTDAAVVEQALADLDDGTGYPDDLLVRLNQALEEANVGFRVGQIDPSNVTAACYVSGDRYLTNNQFQGNFAYLLGKGGCSYEERDAEVVLNLTFGANGAEVAALTQGREGTRLAGVLEQLIAESN